MPKLIHAQTEFTTGQASFRIRGRSNIEKYGGGLRKIQNFRVLPQGPIELRNGTLIINRVKDLNNPPRLLRFIVSITQSFILEFGDKYIRFFVSNGLVADSQAPNQAFEVETPYTLEQVFELQFTQSEFSLIITHGDVPQQELIFNGGGPDDWFFEEFTPSPPPTFESGFTPVADLTLAALTGLGINAVASNATFSAADVGRAIEGIDPSFGVASIKTFTNATTVIVDIIADFDELMIPGGEWLIDLSPLIEIGFNDITRTGGIATITTVPSTAGVFRDEFIGDYILVHGGVIQILTVTATGNGCECEILKSMTASDNTENWTLEKPTWDEIRGFPRTVTQADQRLLFAGTFAQPQTIWPSEIGIINGFGIGIEDSDSFEMDIVSNEITTINWINTAKDIIVGTSGGESTINISTASLTPSLPEISVRSSYRSGPQSTIVVGSEVIFIQKGERKVLTYFFDFSSDTFKGEDLTFFSEDITKSGIKQIAYGQEPNKQILAVTNKGTLLSGTFDRGQNVIAFTEYVTDGKYLSVQTIPEGEIDQVWVVVERQTAIGKDVFVEVFDDSSGESSTDVFTDSSVIVSNPIPILSASRNEDAIFYTAFDHLLEVGDQIMFKDFTQWTGIDQDVFNVTEIVDDDSFKCGFNSFNQPTITTDPVVFKTITKITGLGHLEGKTVGVKVDNGAHESQVVTDGEISLNDDEVYAEAVVGLEYIGEMLTLPPEFDGGIGSMQAQLKSIVYAALRVDRSANPTFNGNDKPNQRPQDIILDQAKPLFSGDLIYQGFTGATTDGLIQIKSIPLFPLRILAIYTAYQADYR